MLFHPNYGDHLDRVASQLRVSQAVTAELISELVSEVCIRLPALNRTGTAAGRIDRLVRSSAWTDVALALIEIEFPQWKLRRLIYEDGEWLCSLSRQPNLPPALDETVDASHEILPLAMLTALVEARRLECDGSPVDLPAGSQTSPTADRAICCDNFA